MIDKPWFARALADLLQSHGFDPDDISDGPLRHKTACKERA